MDSSTEAVSFILSLAGIMAAWSGLMKIAEESGLISGSQKQLSLSWDSYSPKKRTGSVTAMMIMSLQPIYSAPETAPRYSPLKPWSFWMRKTTVLLLRATPCACSWLSPMSMLQLVPVTMMKIRKRSGIRIPRGHYPALHSRRSHIV